MQKIANVSQKTIINLCKTIKISHKIVTEQQAVQNKTEKHTKLLQKGIKQLKQMQNDHNDTQYDPKQTQNEKKPV